MPTSTYNNLPQQKKEKLLKATRQELRETPYNKISINKIIKNAGIARGSFYQYFEDKEDLLIEVFKDEIASFESFVGDELTKEHHNLFEIYSLAVRKLVEICTSEENIEICKNLLGYIPIRESTFAQRFPLTCNNPINILRKYVDPDVFVYHTEDEIRNAIEILVAITKFCIVGCFTFTDRIPQILDDFDVKIEMIKHGIIKKI